MRNQIQINEELNIISRKIDNATTCCVVDICEDCFKVKLNRDAEYEKDESVELFTSTKKGQLYFETIVKDVEENVLSIWFPITFKYLQRREFSRIQTNKKIILKDNEKTINSKIIDISAGGLKIKIDEQLELLKQYEVQINIDNRDIKTLFEPIRLEATQDGFIASGSFKTLSNYDRITLVQYCFRKQIENSNK